VENNELQQIEAENGVVFSLNGERKVEATGTAEAIDRALQQISDRGELVVLLRQRQGLPEIDEEPVVTRMIPVGVPSVEVQRQNYVRWFTAQPKYFQPKPEELDLMFAAVEEGDELVFDFAQSFTVRKPNGLLISVDRKGRIGKPSPYSPALKGK
jgi:hypothetical protein